MLFGSCNIDDTTATTELSSAVRVGEFAMARVTSGTVKFRTSDDSDAYELVMNYPLQLALCYSDLAAPSREPRLPGRAEDRPPIALTELVTATTLLHLLTSETPHHLRVLLRLYWFVFLVNL